MIGEAGVLIRGASGSGKSSLALALLDDAARDGLHARLVGDDRVALTARHGRLVARPHPALAGLIEVRGHGLCRMTRTAEAAVVRLVVDLVEGGPRLPTDAPRVEVAGVALRGLRLERGTPREYLVRQALAALRQGGDGPGVSRGSHFAALVPDDLPDP